MNNEHLSDEQLQEYVLDSAACAPAVGAHVRSCPACQAKVEAYQLVILAIEEQPIPSFNFDVSEAVLAHITAQTQQKEQNWWIYLLLFSGLIAGAIALYLFRIEVAALFKAGFVIYLCVTIGVCIMVAAVIDQVKNYKNKIALFDL